MPEEKAVSVDELYDYLKRFSLSDSLYALGLINASMQFGRNGLEESGIPPPILTWVRKNFPTEHDKRLVMLQVSRLARFLILSGTNDYKKPYLDVGTDQ